MLCEFGNFVITLIFNIKYVIFVLLGKQRWTAADRANNPIEVQYNAFLQNLGVSSPGYEALYFVAPGKIKYNSPPKYLSKVIHSRTSVHWNFLEWKHWITIDQ